MPKNKNILFTFDYELFLGSRSGTVDRCLISPVEKIICVFKKFNAKGIFFVDTTYLYRLKQEKGLAAREDYIKILQQIQTIIREGHYVFPHIHPHWIDAKYDPSINQWDLSDISKYRFHHISEQERKNIFTQSIELLNEIIKPVKPDYHIDAFRAGGWSIQPFEDYKPLFLQYGIRYDFTVLSGFSGFSAAQHFDFSNVPKKNIYSFENDVAVEDANGRFTEFTISSVRISSFLRFCNQWFNRYLARIKKDKNFGDGRSVPSKSLLKDSPDIKHFYREMVSVELMNAVKLHLYVNFLKHNDYMQFITHPKMISPHNLFIFEKFLEKIFSVYECETDFKKMKR